MFDGILNVLFSIFLIYNINKFPVMLIIWWMYPVIYFCTVTSTLFLGTPNNKGVWISLLS